MNCRIFARALTEIDNLPVHKVAELIQHSRECVKCRKALYEARKKAQIEWRDNGKSIPFDLHFAFEQLMETSR